jgi:hypothetical protein
MAPGIAVPPALEADIRVFLAEAGIGLAIVPDNEAVVSVLPAVEGPRRDAGPGTLPSGGTIRCAVALAMAPLLGIATKDLGRLLNHLGIKVRDCSLGCFP